MLSKLILAMLNIQNILFLDIETVTASHSLETLDNRLQELWKKKAERLVTEQPDSSLAKLYFEKGAIYAEFGKVFCIGLGYLVQLDGQWEARLKCLTGKDEKDLLQQFSDLLVKHTQTFTHLCAHNGKEFDFPYLCRRMLINGIAIPPQLQIAGLKPWEINHLDTMELWKFGDRKNYTSLDLLAAVFDIDSPKGNIDGSMVNEYYYNKKAWNEISQYCQRDVWAMMQIYLKMQQIPLNVKEVSFADPHQSP